MSSSVGEEGSCPYNVASGLVLGMSLLSCVLGAGLIKLRGGEEWRDLTAMDYFYEVPRYYDTELRLERNIRV